MSPQITTTISISPVVLLHVWAENVAKGQPLRRPMTKIIDVRSWSMWQYSQIRTQHRLSRDFGKWVGQQSCTLSNTWSVSADFNIVERTASA